MKLDPETPGYVVLAAINPNTGLPDTRAGINPITGLPYNAPSSGQADTSGSSVTINANNANQNTGVATAGSTAGISGNGKATASVQVTANTLGAALQPQGSIDGITWVNLGPIACYNQATGAWTNTIPSGVNGDFTVGIADFPFFRLTSPTTGVTGSATVWLNSSATMAIVSTEPARYNPAVNTASALVKTGAGVLHAVDVAATAAAAVAGLLTVYDNTAASGTILYQEYITTGVLAHSAILDVAFQTGLYVAVAATSVSISTPYL